MTNYTTINANLNSSTYRLAAQREAQAKKGDRQAWLERYLRERAEFSWTATYKAFEAELEALKGVRAMSAQYLIDQAWALHTRLNNKAYSIACVYIKYNWYVKSSENDERLNRLNDILGRSERRIARRLANSKKVK